MPELRLPPGTFDVLPPESSRWEAVVSTFARTVSSAGYGFLLTPTFEDLAVFQRVGEATDVVRKEMYDFEDKGGRRIALRPEFTASAVRSYVQHKPTTPWKVWYAGSGFRYEKPQAGRYREFHQLGIEAVGSSDADLDVEVVTLGWDFLTGLGLRQVELLVNTLGDANCRPAYRELLLSYLQARREQLCEEHRERLEANPLRALDCKTRECRAATADAPRQIDHLCDDCATHFERVIEGLKDLEVPYKLDTSLVRGLDYYSRTTFEYAGAALASAQNALGGGGRYDALVSEMGGPETPAIGLAIGIERVLLAADAEKVLPAASASVDVFVVDLADGRSARSLTRELRSCGIRADRAFDGRSAKAQFRAADRSGARLALVIGPDELAAGTVSVRSLAGGEDKVGSSQSATSQSTLARKDVVEEVKRRLAEP